MNDNSVAYYNEIDPEAAAWAADRAADSAAELRLQASDLLELLAAAPIPGKANG